MGECISFTRYRQTPTTETYIHPLSLHMPMHMQVKWRPVFPSVVLKTGDFRKKNKLTLRYINTSPLFYAVGASGRDLDLRSGGYICTYISTV